MAAAANSVNELRITVPLKCADTGTLFLHTDRRGPLPSVSLAFAVLEQLNDQHMREYLEKQQQSAPGREIRLYS